MRASVRRSVSVGDLSTRYRELQRVNALARFASPDILAKNSNICYYRASKRGLAILYSWRIMMKQAHKARTRQDGRWAQRCTNNHEDDSSFRRGEWRTTPRKKPKEENPPTTWAMLMAEEPSPALQ